LPRSRQVGGITLDVHTLLFASLAVVIGFQSMMFWAFATIYGMREGIVPPDPWFRSLAAHFTLEAGLIASAALLLAGLGLAAYALGYWGAQRFGPLPVTETMRFVIPSTTAFLLGFQILHGAFFFSVLEIRASQSSQATKPGPRA
jgi:hypothetical protein